MDFLTQGGRDVTGAGFGHGAGAVSGLGPNIGGLSINGINSGSGSAGSSYGFGGEATSRDIETSSLNSMLRTEGIFTTGGNPEEVI